MSLKKLVINSDAYYVALQHALSTESDEVMGLLFGEIDEGSHELHVLVARCYTRVSKQRDRVEIAPEQLQAAALYADQLSSRMGRSVRVLGWYHSHPHITVWPSHVDLRMQTSLQTLDEHFAGVIFSVYSARAGCTDSEGRAAAQNIRAVCFQTAAAEASDRPRIVPLRVRRRRALSPECARALLELPRLLADEERATWSSVCTRSCAVTRRLNEAVLRRNMCHLLGVLTAPLYSVIQTRLEQNEEIKLRLSAERDRLRSLINNDVSVSPTPNSSSGVDSSLCREVGTGRQLTLDVTGDKRSSNSPPSSPCMQSRRKRRLA